MSRFSATHTELVAFKKFLTSLDGGLREEPVADAIVTDIAKVAHFLNPKQFLWAVLVDPPGILWYLQVLTDKGVGPEGRLTYVRTLLSSAPECHAEGSARLYGLKTMMEVIS